MEIKFYNRKAKVLETEKVYGDKAMKLMYESKLGQFFANILSHSPLSLIYGHIQSSSIFSKRKIKPFISDFSINMEDYLPEEGFSAEAPYPHFNSFFIRRFKAGRRPFALAPQMGAFAEARYYAYESVQPDNLIPVKGKFLSPEVILDNPKWNETFKDGPLLLARLCPVDYHRYHFPDNGRVIDQYTISGALHSVNPIALQAIPSILCQNERQVAILETENLGKLAYI